MRFKYELDAFQDELFKNARAQGLSVYLDADGFVCASDDDNAKIDVLRSAIDTRVLVEPWNFWRRRPSSSRPSERSSMIGAFRISHLSRSTRGMATSTGSRYERSPRFHLLVVRGASLDLVERQN